MDISDTVGMPDSIDVPPGYEKSHGEDEFQGFLPPYVSGRSTGI
jgi:hypothetical protein